MEFAIVAIPFVAIMLAIFQTTIVYAVGQVLETAVEQSGRQLMTGIAQNGGMTQSQYQSLVCARASGLFNCSGLMVDVQVASSFAAANTTMPTLTFSKTGAVTNAWSYAPGNPGDIVIVRVMYQWPVLGGPLGFTLSNLSNGNRLLVATSVFKNEQYK